MTTSLTYTGRPGDFNPAAALDRLIEQGIDAGKITLSYVDDLSAVTVIIYDDPDKTIRAAVEAEFAHHDPSVQSARQAAAAEREANRNWAKAHLEGLDTGTLDSTLAALVLLAVEK
jgi:hypothetical protein